MGIDVVEDYAFETPDGRNICSSVLTHFPIDPHIYGKVEVRVFVINANSTLQEKVKSLACCLVYMRTPGGWKKDVIIDGQRFWLESVCGKRDPDIDRRADRYIAFLLRRSQRESGEKQCKENPSVKTA